MQQDNAILTVSGHLLSLRAPDYRTLDIQSTAHSLAIINRFTGHTSRPYSVAEHSLLVCEIIAQGGGSILAQLAGLMHDAHEQIVGEITSPMKAEMRRYAAAQTFEAKDLPQARVWSQFDRIDAAAAGCVRAAFKLITISSVFRDVVHAADMIALATERRDLMPHHPIAWECLDGWTPMPGVDLMDQARQTFTWTDWRDAFIERYAELDYARQLFERDHQADLESEPRSAA